MPFYKKTIATVLRELKTNKQGLSNTEAKKRQKSYGLNKLKEKKQVSAFQIFLNQFKSTLIAILIIATIVSALIGETVDAIVILVIVALNAFFGFIQEYKADKAIENLKNVMNQKTKVLRNGKIVEIDASLITLGDIMVLEEGDHISADGRLIKAINLKILESSLTGESVAVQKTNNTFSQDLVLGDQKNMVFSGTSVTKGRGLAVVTAIGMDTEIGKIADLIQNIPNKTTHLQKQLSKLSKRLGITILIICIVIFGIYYLIDHESLLVAFLTAVALAVAAIPEGLPAVVTISLGLGIKRMVKKNALMRRLSSVETLGGVDVICTDKTGTLTKNEMTVTKVFVDNTIISVSGVGYSSQGNFEKESPSLEKLLEIGLLCNQAQQENGTIIGDPTEGALLISAVKYGLKQDILSKKFLWNDEIPFDSERKMMTVFYHKHDDKKQLFSFSKGAPELLLDKCDRILINGKIKKLNKLMKQEILTQNNLFASDALRVLGFAYNEGDSKSMKKNEKNLIFVGLQAMIDPPRQEIKESIHLCKKAGIRVIMITGDNVVTAQAIARSLGINGNAIQGTELDNIDNKQLKKILQNTNIFARVNPIHKQQIVHALKEMGHITAMTGDGVNDAPALKQADIGIAMGITGTDVSKESADMILLDDNFSTIVSAIKEGRGIYDNIKKFVNYLLSSNLGEIAIILTMSLLGLPLPLLAIQLLWINLVTDGLPAIALGVDPVAKGIMHKKPRDSKENIINQEMLINIIIIAILMTLGSLFIFYRHYQNNLTEARTAVFVLMVLMELVRVQIIRSRFHLKFWENKWLLGALSLSVLLVLAVIYSPLHIIFKTLPLSWNIRGEIVGIILLFIFIGTIINRLFERKRKK